MIKIMIIGLILLLVLFLYCACVLSSRCSLEEQKMIGGMKNKK